MVKKIMLTSVAVGAMFGFVGCGAVDDIIEDIKDEVKSTGTAFYVDSAVSGVNYVCGSESGITDASGAFTFEVGASCTFYLGDIELRNVAVEELIDGESVVETDVEIARVLQSLDSDGNPDNGITIDAEIVTAMAEAGITTLPDTAEELAVFEEVLLANDLALVTLEDAQDHLDETKLMLLLAGKTLYVGVYGEMPTLESWTYSADLTSAAWQEMVDVDGRLDNGTGDLSVSGMTMTYTCTYDSGADCSNEDPAVMTITDILEDYMLISIVIGDYTSVDRVYYDEAKAREYYLGDADNMMIITEAMLSGKTFYDYDSDGNGEYGYGKMTVTATTLTRSEIWYDANGSVTFQDTFTLPSALIDGKIRVDVSDFGDGYLWFGLLSETPDIWEMKKAKDIDMDGLTEDSSESTPTWYLSKPADFPDSL